MPDGIDAHNYVLVHCATLGAPQRYFDVESSALVYIRALTRVAIVPS